MTDLAQTSNIEDRLGRDLTDAESARVENVLIPDASAVIIGYCRQDFGADYAEVPDVITAVVSKMVVRSLLAGDPKFVDSESIGPSTVRYSQAASAGDVWLTASDKLALRPYRRGGGMTSVGLVGERYDPASEA